MKLLLLFCFIFPLSVSAGDAKKNILQLGTGIAGFRFMVDDKNGDRLASMENKSKFIPFIGYTSVPRPFWSRWPWLRGSLEFSVSPFRADRQNTGRLTEDNGKKPIDGVDLGTEVKGFAGHISPSLLLFYSFSDLYYAYVGLGLGVGFASLKGDYFNVTGKQISSACRSSSRASDVIANCEKEKVDYRGVGLSANTLFGLSLNRIGMKFDMGGPNISSNGKKYTSYNSMFSIFYQYRF